MKLESLKGAKFKPLSSTQMCKVRGGDAGITSGASNEQAGTPMWNDAAGCYIVRTRFWTADSFKDGVWCYENERYGDVYTPTLPPR
ncbi:hypothetical protein ACLOAU_02535 [Niabella sp. CJ426]|uniref:hypothetical protein n=1 Tax=Niabella sp. CJ426 TaxID=3393740 RepID=UPI003CFD17B2